MVEGRALTLGETLRRARLERGLSLAEIEVALHVRVRYLQALEMDEYSALPPPVYTRMLIREYARYLGLDPAVVLDLAPTLRVEERNTIRHALQPLERPAIVSWKAVVSVAVLSLCAGLFLYLYAQYNSFTQSVDLARGATLPTPSSRGFSAAVTPITAFPTETPLPTVTPPPSPTAIAGLVVEARLTDRSWVQVWTDGREVLAETLPAGTTRAFTAEQAIRMRVGNAGAVTVAVNGEPQGVLGGAGVALDVTWGRE